MSSYTSYFFPSEGGGGCADIPLDASGNVDLARERQPLIYEPGESWGPVDEFIADDEYWPATQYASASGILRVRFPNGGGSGCSATLINGAYLVTAHHCVAGADELTEFSFIAAPFDSDHESRQSLLRERLEAMGFRGAALDDAVDIVNTNDVPDLGLGNWRCRLVEQDGDRDVAYLICDPKFFYDQDSSHVTLFPGDIFGFADPIVTAPTTGTDVTLTSANITQARYDAGESRSVSLISPNGYAQNNGSLSCDYGANGTYSGCIGAQGVDFLPGSSGGLMLLRDDHLAYGVASGHSWMSSTYPGRTPVPHIGSQYNNNKNLIAPFSSLVLTYANEVYTGHMGTVPATGITQPFGAMSNSLHSARCLDSEAMVGVVGTWVFPELFGTEARLGTLGSVCNNLYQGLGLKFFRGMYVQTPGAADTSYFATPPRASAERMELYRYLNTVVSKVVLFILPLPLRQQLFMCPGNRAVYRVTAAVEDGEILAITSLGCRSNDSQPDLEINIPGTRLGEGTSTSTLVTRSCSTNRVAMGMNIYADGRTTDMRLLCRDW